MKRFPFFVCLAFLLLLFQVGIMSADSPVNMTGTDAIAAATTTTPGTTGGSIYFETDPSDASIWLATVDIGTTPFTYYSENTGTLSVHIQKKGYEDYSGTVTVISGQRIEYPRCTNDNRYDNQEVDAGDPHTLANINGISG
jgi:hypothetical protein